MRYHVCTLMYGTAYERYGKRFIETFDANWNIDIPLHIVTDHSLENHKDHKQHMLYNNPDFSHFMAKFSQNKSAQGLGHEVYKVDQNGVSWRHNAVKWAPQAFAANMVASGLWGGMQKGDVLIVLDADVYTKGPVDQAWLNRVIGNADVTYLGRQNQHSEIGWYSLKIGNATKNMLDHFAQVYYSGDFLKYEQSHSAYMFDVSLSRAMRMFPELRVRNLNTENLRGHVWPYTVLDEKLVHLKGKRKENG